MHASSASIYFYFYACRPTELVRTFILITDCSCQCQLLSQQSPIHVADAVSMPQQHINPTTDNVTAVNVVDVVMGDSAEFDALKAWPPLIVLLTVVYIVVIVIGALGNSLTVVAVVTRRRRELDWNATNILIANLALADTFVCVIDLPMSLYYQLTDDWVCTRFLLQH